MTEADSNFVPTKQVSPEHETLNPDILINPSNETEPIINSQPYNERTFHSHIQGSYKYLPILPVTGTAVNQNSFWTFPTAHEEIYPILETQVPPDQRPRLPESSSSILRSLIRFEAFQNPALRERSKINTST